MDHLDPQVKVVLLVVCWGTKLEVEGAASHHLESQLLPLLVMDGDLDEAQWKEPGGGGKGRLWGGRAAGSCNWRGGLLPWASSLHPAYLTDLFAGVYMLLYR